MDDIGYLIKKEEKRQKETLMLIPSENYTYPEVRTALGSVFVHKYAEGYPGKRYYQGMEYADQIECICQIEALKTFNLSDAIWGVNVQPYSGSPANLELFNALLSPKDKILSLSLTSGGHLSHGWHLKDKPITLTSKIFNVDFYSVDPYTGLINYNTLEKKALEFKPKIIVSGGTSYPSEIDHEKISYTARKVNALYLADIAHEAGLVAGGVNTSPFNFADIVTMTTHKTLRGPRGAIIFAKKKLMESINKSVFPGIQGGPHLNTIAAIAIAFKKAQTEEFKNYARDVVDNAKELARTLKGMGYDLISGGTEKHLILLDLRSRKINGWYAAHALEKGGIIVNKNTLPADPNPPYYPSGIRLGTPAVTARGMRKTEMVQTAELIDSVIRYLGVREIPKDKEIRDLYLSKYKTEITKDAHLERVATQVRTLCKKFPIEF